MTFVQKICECGHSIYLIYIHKTAFSVKIKCFNCNKEEIIADFVAPLR